MSGKHTPGPWKTDPEFDNEFVVGPDGKLVADCSCSVVRTSETIQANARLIAAAPELLAALKETRNAAEAGAFVCVKDGFAKRADDLIARIEGQTL